MKITVIGAGAMGAMFGAKLARSGQEVSLVDVWRDHVEAINREGLLLKYKGNEGERIPVRAVCSAGELSGPVDLVIVFVKGIYTDEAVRAARHLIGPGTRVLTLQNGIGNAETIAGYASPRQVIMGTTKDCATLLQPGVVNDTTEPASVTTQITAMDGENDERVQEVASALTAAGSGTQVSEDTQAAIWQKLIINCCVNATCMLTRISMGDITNDPCGVKLQAAIIGEICAVAARKGIRIDPEETHAFIRSYYKTSTHFPSMLQDAYKKARTEIETITGAVVREGAAQGVAVPANETLYYLVKIVENNYDKMMY